MIHTILFGFKKLIISNIAIRAIFKNTLSFFYKTASRQVLPLPNYKCFEIIDIENHTQTHTQTHTHARVGAYTQVIKFRAMEIILGGGTLIKGQ